MNSAKDKITLVSGPDDITEGGLAYISDCSNADIFKVSKEKQGNGTVRLQFKKKDNDGKDLSKPYSRQATVSAFRITQYFVADSDAATLVDGSPAPALWRSVDGTPTELVQGVQNMQLQYGLDTDSDSSHSADVYKTADSVTDWDEVVSVRAALLIQSLTLATDTVDTTSTYRLLDKTVVPFGDRYLRRVVTFTVALRNRVH